MGKHKKSKEAPQEEENTNADVLQRIEDLTETLNELAARVEKLEARPPATSAGSWPGHVPRPPQE